MTIQSNLDHSFDNISLVEILQLGLPFRDFSDISLIKDIDPIKIFDL